MPNRYDLQVVGVRLTVFLALLVGNSSFESDSSVQEMDFGMNTGDRTGSSDDTVETLRAQSVALQRELEAYDSAQGGRQPSTGERLRVTTLRQQLTALQTQLFGDERKDEVEKVEGEDEEVGEEQEEEKEEQQNEEGVEDVQVEVEHDFHRPPEAAQIGSSTPRGATRAQHSARVRARGRVASNHRGPPAPLGVTAMATLTNDGNDQRASPDPTGISERPGAGSRDVDVVRFGIYAKAFYGIDLVDHTFTIDSVMTLKWSDSRTADLIPSDAVDVTLSAKDASSTLWTPEVVITNVDVRELQPISSSISVEVGGMVTKVERSLAVMRNKFDITAFPFDEQVLQVRIASGKYMMDEVALMPLNDTDATGVHNGIFDGMGFSLVSFRTSSFDDIDGKLRKSRGVLELTVGRNFAGYLQIHLVPSVLLLALSYSVFWFPFQEAFITSRLALSILSLLCFAVLSLKVSRQFPLGSTYTWHDLFNQNCQWLLFFTVCLNIFTEIVYHQCKCDVLGISMNHEAKVLWPILAVLSFGIVCLDFSGKWLPTQALITTFVLVGTMTLYSCWSCSRLSVHMEENELEEAAWSEYGEDPPLKY